MHEAATRLLCQQIGRCVTPENIDAIRKWVIECGLSGTEELDLLEGFCTRCRAGGIDLSRGMVLIDTLHPVYEGRMFRWRKHGVVATSMVEYGRTNQGGEHAQNWRRSVHHHLLSTHANEFCCHLGRDEADFFTFDAMRRGGITGFASFIHRFAQEGSLGDMDCVYSSWSTHNPDGFRDIELAALRELLPSLALAMKCRSLVRVASTLVEVYLGRGAGKRVLSGCIARGVAEHMTAVLWFSDLRGFTAITDTTPEEVIPLLNDYSAAAIAAVHKHGGDVLKLMGDGVLAIFHAADSRDAVRYALKAEGTLRTSNTEVNARRREKGQPVTSIYLGLHIGEVLFGNIGSEERLDFTVVGPAVNEVSRISSMCRSVDRAVVISSAFAAAAAAPDRGLMISLGRFALRGVSRAEELFTLDTISSHDLFD